MFQAGFCLMLLSLTTTLSWSQTTRIDNDPLIAEINHILRSRFAQAQAIELYQYRMDTIELNRFLRRLKPGLEQADPDLNLNGLDRLDLLVGDAYIIRFDHVAETCDVAIDPNLPMETLIPKVAEQLKFCRKTFQLQREIAQILQSAFQFQGSFVALAYQKLEIERYYRGLETFHQVLLERIQWGATANLSFLDKVAITSSKTEESIEITITNRTQLNLLIPAVTPAETMHALIFPLVALEYAKFTLMQTLRACCNLAPTAQLVINGNLESALLERVITEFNTTFTAGNFNANLADIKSIVITTGLVSNKRQPTAPRDLYLPIGESGQRLLTTLGRKLQLYREMDLAIAQLKGILADRFQFTGIIQPDYFIDDTTYTATLRAAIEVFSNPVLSKDALAGVDQFVIHNGSEVSLRSPSRNGEIKQIYIPARVPAPRLLPALTTQLQLGSLIREIEGLLQNNHQLDPRASLLAALSVEPEELSSFLPLLRRVVQAEAPGWEMSALATIRITSGDGVPEARLSNQTLNISTNIPPQLLSATVQMALLSPEQIEQEVDWNLREYNYLGPSLSPHPSADPQGTIHQRGVRKLWLAMNTNPVDLDLSRIRQIWLGAGRWGGIWSYQECPRANCTVLWIHTDLPPNTILPLVALEATQLQQKLVQLLAQHGHNITLNPSWSASEAEFAQGVELVWSALQTLAPRESSRTTTGNIAITGSDLQSREPWIIPTTPPTLHVPANASIEQLAPYLQTLLNQSSLPH